MENETIASEHIGNERLLSIKDVATITGLCPVIASKVMTESGHGITLHRRKFILESSLLSYLKEMEQ